MKQQIQIGKQTDGSVRVQACLGKSILADITLGAADAVTFARQLLEIVEGHKIAGIVKLSHESNVEGTVWNISGRGNGGAK